jgi:hypothetical protein
MRACLGRWHPAPLKVYPVSVILRKIAVTPEGAALGRFRGRATAAADRKALQAPAARPLLEQQDLADYVGRRAHLVDATPRIDIRGDHRMWGIEDWRLQ